MAHKKGQGSSRNGRDSNAQRRGVKRFGGEQVARGTSLSAKWAISFTPEKVSARVPTTRSTRWWTATSSSTGAAGGSRSSETAAVPAAALCQS